MTFSILAFDPGTGESGIALQSKFPGVGAIALHGRVEAGIVSTQALANSEHGEHGLDLLALGASPEQVVEILLRNDPSPGKRQLAIMNRAGTYATYTGDEVRNSDGWSGYRAGRDCIAHGNSLTGQAVVDRMMESFQATEGELAARLIEALRAGQAAGGDIRGKQSAAILVLKEGGGYGGRSGRHVDISVYDNPAPIEELARCYRLHRLTHFPSDPKNLIKIDLDLAAELRGILVAQSFLQVPADGAWNEADIAAMRRFMDAENYDNRLRDDALIDTEVLADIRIKHQPGA